jgi:hypothetical protein
MRIFLTRAFAQFARRQRIADATLLDAARRAESGLIDANLGGGVIKQRIARPGAGKSGGYRAIIVFRMRTRAIFMYGFAKNERDNVTAAELHIVRKSARVWLELTEAEMTLATAKRQFEEVAYHG